MKKLLFILVTFVFCAGCNSTQEMDLKEHTQPKPSKASGCEQYSGRERAQCLIAQNKELEQVRNAKPHLKIDKERQDDTIVEHHELCWIVEETKEKVMCTSWDEFQHSPTLVSKLLTYGGVGLLAAAGGYVIGATKLALLALKLFFL